MKKIGDQKEKVGGGGGGGHVPVRGLCQSTLTEWMKIAQDSRVAGIWLFVICF